MNQYLTYFNWQRRTLLQSQLTGEEKNHQLKESGIAS